MKGGIEGQKSNYPQQGDREDGQKKIEAGHCGDEQSEAVEIQCAEQDIEYQGAATRHCRWLK